MTDFQYMSQDQDLQIQSFNNQQIITPQQSNIKSEKNPDQIFSNLTKQSSTKPKVYPTHISQLYSKTNTTSNLFNNLIDQSQDAPSYEIEMDHSNSYKQQLIQIQQQVMSNQQYLQDLLYNEIQPQPFTHSDYYYQQSSSQGFNKKLLLGIPLVLISLYLLFGVFLQQATEVSTSKLVTLTEVEEVDYIQVDEIEIVDFPSFQYKLNIILLNSSTQINFALEETKDIVEKKYTETYDEYLTMISHNIENGIMTENVMTELTSFYTEYYPTMIQEIDGYILTNNEGTLYVLDQKLQEILEYQLDTDSYFYGALTMNDKLIVASDDYIYVYDNSTLELSTIETDSRALVMIPISQTDGNETLLAAEEDGYIEIFNISSLSLIYSYKLSNKPSVWAMKETTNGYNETSGYTEYALATSKGFVLLQLNNETYDIVEMEEEYLKNENVRTFVEYEEGLFVLGVMESKNSIQTIDRCAQTVNSTFNTASESEYPLQIELLPNFDSQDYPYALLRESEQLLLIDIKNAKSYILISDIEYSYKYDGWDGDYYNWVSSFMVLEDLGNQFEVYLTTANSDDPGHIYSYLFKQDFLEALKRLQNL